MIKSDRTVFLSGPFIGFCVLVLCYAVANGAVAAQKPYLSWSAKVGAPDGAPESSSEAAPRSVQRQSLPNQATGQSFAIPPSPYGQVGGFMRELNWPSKVRGPSQALEARQVQPQFQPQFQPQAQAQSEARNSWDIRARPPFQPRSSDLSNATVASNWTPTRRAPEPRFVPSLVPEPMPQQQSVPQQPVPQSQRPEPRPEPRFEPRFEPRPEARPEPRLERQAPVSQPIPQPTPQPIPQALTVPEAPRIADTLPPPPPNPAINGEYRVPASSKYAGRISEPPPLEVTAQTKPQAQTKAQAEAKAQSGSKSEPKAKPVQTTALAKAAEESSFVPFIPGTRTTDPRQGARIYSLHREFGLQPDPAPNPGGDLGLDPEEVTLKTETPTPVQR
jgi:hypothetical protein